MKFLRIFFFVLACCPTFTWGQSARLAKFAVSKVDYSSALIQWTMTKGSTCLRMEVQRSSDGINFRTVYIYPGVCGDLDEEKSYSWADGSAYPFSLNYYRLKLAETEFSLLVEVDLDSELAQQEIILFPNPSKGNISFKLRNPDKEPIELRVYDLNGNMLFKDRYSERQSFELDFNFLKTGNYIVEILFLESRRRSRKFFQIIK